MPQCCAYGCYTQQIKGGMKLFKIPENKTKRKLWLQKISRRNWTLTKNARLCEKHFTDDQFEPNRADGAKILKRNAVPTIFSHKEQPTQRSRRLLKRKLNPLEDIDEANCSSAPDEDNIIPPVHDAPNQQLCSLEEKARYLESTLRSVRNELKHCKADYENLSKGMTKLFKPDQIQFMAKGTMKGFSWSQETVQQSLKIRLACGSTGYNTLKDMQFPLPCERTLQRRLQNISFKPGILREMFPAIEMKLKSMKPEERYAVLMIDEMAITPGLGVDVSSGDIFGKSTVPSSTLRGDDLATHALVFMLGGITTRWKQVVAYHLTGNSFCAKTVKNIIFEIVVECEKLGLFIDVVASDMGGNNQAVWRECGITASKYTEMKNSCSHPVCPTRKLFFMPDPPHIMKNIRNALTGNQIFTIPESVRDKYDLPCSEISIKSIKDLHQLDKKFDLKLAPRLTENVLNPSHFQKMKVGPALALLNHDIAAALEYAVKENHLHKFALSTAWFLKLMHKWFYLITSRSKKNALSHFSERKYEDSIKQLQEVAEIIGSMEISKPGSKICYKPLQRGVCLATKTVLDISKVYLEEKGFHYVLLSRFGQDALENLFGNIRSKTPIPNACEFKQSLRVVSLSHFFQPIKHGSYETDEGEQLIDFLKFRNEEQTLEDQDIQTEINYEELFSEIDIAKFDVDKDEKQSLYYLCGRTVLMLQKRHNLKCTVCLNFMKKGNETDNDVFEDLTNLKKYVPSYEKETLIHTSEAVFQLLNVCEKVIRQKELDILANKTTRNHIISYVMSVESDSLFPECHNIKTKLLKIFITCRMYFLVRKFNNSIQNNKQIKCGSKSVGMRKAVN